MAKYLVIVESPTKAKTISGFLGKDYEVSSSMGHVVDLPSKSLGIKIEEGFIPTYRVISGKEKIVNILKKKAKNKKIVYLATDPDREGEAISWHIKNILERGKLGFYRVVFHEITESAIKEAFNNAADIDINRVNAQKVRRILDRIVGYYLSPLLWKKVLRGLSAGRVQSIALKFIVEREKEIDKFIPATTYELEALFRKDNSAFKGHLRKFNNKKAVFSKEYDANSVLEILSKKKFFVKEVRKKESKRRPPAPFTTSLLQQDAFNKLRFSSKKTMLIAQKLYEGITVGGKMVGLITYMRTDSFRIADKAKDEAKLFIGETFGNNYICGKDYKYKEKKSAQLAHEAIRPTKFHLTPDSIEVYLKPDELKLYKLIWRRSLSVFMKEAVIENSRVLIKSEDAEFSAEGKRVIFDGFLKVSGFDKDKTLPSLLKGDEVALENIDVIEKTTRPPARFTDASLVKLMEEKGIGRPSTYAPTISTLIFRNYVYKEKGYFIPSDLGIRVCELLVEYFSDIMNESFSARIEEKLDDVEEGKIDGREILDEFYPIFKDRIDHAAKIIKKHVEFVDKKCPKCGRLLMIKWSRRGRFLSCSGFPECKYAESITTGIKCPGCGEGELIERRNKRGQLFYGCSKFPECHYTTRTLPENTGVHTD